MSLWFIRRITLSSGKIVHVSKETVRRLNTEKIWRLLDRDRVLRVEKKTSETPFSTSIRCRCRDELFVFDINFCFLCMASGFKVLRDCLLARDRDSRGVKECTLDVIVNRRGRFLIFRYANLLGLKSKNCLKVKVCVSL